MKKQAFTLIELLVVVLIIGILAAIAVPQYQKAVVKSRLSTLKDLVSSMKNAEEVYYLANGKYTDKFEDLDITLPGTLGEDGVYYGDYGYCSLDLSSAYCNITGLLYFGKNFDNINISQSNRTICGAEFYNNAANQVCQDETNTTTPTWTGNGEDYKWNSYTYLK